MNKITLGWRYLCVSKFWSYWYRFFILIESSTLLASLDNEGLQPTILLKSKFVKHCSANTDIT